MTLLRVRRNGRDLTCGAKNPGQRPAISGIARRPNQQRKSPSETERSAAMTETSAVISASS